jgi:hypothetical protein
MAKLKANTTNLVFIKAVNPHDEIKDSSAYPGAYQEKHFS